jgi:hypothetical protein
VSWHEHLDLEIAAEFRRLEGGLFWAYAEELGHIRKLIKRREWATYAKWWKKTTAGKKCHRDWIKRKRAKLREIVVGIGKCRVCGHGFERKATDRKDRSTCSRVCRAHLAHAITDPVVTIDGRTGTIHALALHYGVKHMTVNYRLRKGWNLREALTTPTHSKRICEVCEATYVTKRADQRYCKPACMRTAIERRRAS